MLINSVASKRFIVKQFDAVTLKRVCRYKLIVNMFSRRRSSVWRPTVENCWAALRCLKQGGCVNVCTQPNPSLNNLRFWNRYIPVFTQLQANSPHGSSIEGVFVSFCVLD